jgi:hypothetical protein
MKTLHFTFRGEQYEVNEQGHIKANGLTYFSDQWIFLGGSSHHWHNRVTVTLAEAFVDPSRLNGCYGWDKDHGTTRTWGGLYFGKTPRIQRAYVEVSA